MRKRKRTEILRFCSCAGLSPILAVGIAVTTMNTGSFGALSETLYVNAAAAEGGDGLSWNAAFNDLQDALSYALMHDEVAAIWVASGIYLPTAADGSRDATFDMRDNLAVYGGFAGDEASLDERDPTVNVTTLSGDIGVPGDATDNSLNVVTASSIDGAILDGFVVRDGRGGPGAGLHIMTSSLAVASCIFEYNYGSEPGGAVAAAAEGSDGEAAWFKQCVFRLNYADFGGAAAFQSSPSLQVSFTNCEFYANQAGFRGGAIDSSVLLSIADCSFHDNIAGAEGGAVSSEVGLSLTGSVFSNNTADWGGALSVEHGFVNDCEFIMNAGQKGGAVFANSEVSFDNVLFQENSAATWGGGISLECDQANGLVRNCQFIGNVAAQGGGVYACDGVQVISSDYIQNHAVAVGGAIYLGGDVDLLMCRFHGNSAELGGGALFIPEVIARIVSCVFTGNTANEWGGAIRQHGGDVLISNCTLAGNQAPIAGGLYAVNKRTVTAIQNSILWGNLAGSHTVIFGQLVDEAGATTIVQYSVIQGLNDSVMGNNNFDFDPLFLDMNGSDDVPGTVDDDIRLSPDSPCIDSGWFAYLVADEWDVDGDGDYEEKFPWDFEGGDRTTGDTVEIGGDEIEKSLACVADLSPDRGDGTVGPGDLALLLAQWGQCPAGGACDADIDPSAVGDGIVGPADLAALLAAWGACP